MVMVSPGQADKLGAKQEIVTGFESEEYMIWKCLLIPCGLLTTCGHVGQLGWPGTIWKLGIVF